jgi:hypothetical protein
MSGGVTTSSTALSSTGLTVIAGGQFWTGDNRLDDLQLHCDRSFEGSIRALSVDGTAQGEPQRRDEQASVLSDREGKKTDSTTVFLCALFILICTEGLYVAVMVIRGRKECPHEKKQF